MAPAEAEGLAAVAAEVTSLALAGGEYRQVGDQYHPVGGQARWPRLDSLTGSLAGIGDARPAPDGRPTRRCSGPTWELGWWCMILVPVKTPQALPPHLFRVPVGIPDVRAPTFSRMEFTPTAAGAAIIATTLHGALRALPAE